MLQVRLYTGDVEVTSEYSILQRTHLSQKSIFWPVGDSTTAPPAWLMPLFRAGVRFCRSGVQVRSPRARAPLRGCWAVPRRQRNPQSGR